jgi:tetratricopeptide (TPR) repeat protein
MTFLASITKKSKLNATIKQTAKARKSEGSTADGLFKAAYQGYAEVLHDDPLRAEALYNWGFALLHQAKTKTGDEAARLYQDAIDKFAFCMLINPDYLGAAINGGVAYMDLARLKGVKPDDKLYELAKKHFEKANVIQAGTASYNLACIYGLRGDKDACLKALENARDKVTLPEASDILDDPDLVTVKEKKWFVEFMETLDKKKEAEAKEVIAEKPPVKEVLTQQTANEKDEAATENKEGDAEKTVVEEATGEDITTKDDDK